MEAVTYIENASKGNLGDITLIEDHRYLFSDGDTQSSPYHMLLKSAKFATKGQSFLVST